MFHVTSDFVYVRLHGDVKIYSSGYTDRALDSWAGRIRAWDKAGRDVYVYFDNDQHAYAPHDAFRLARLLKGSASEAPRPSGAPATIGPSARRLRPGAASGRTPRRTP
jgi:uncharacterized protein YecE (DUF72 family)